MRALGVITVEVPAGWSERSVEGPAVAGGARQTVYKSYEAPDRGGELAVGCYTVPLPFHADELEPIILERLHVAAERTEVAGRIQGSWRYEFPESHGFARTRAMHVGPASGATADEAMELDLYGFDTNGTLQGCFVLCRGACEARAELTTDLAAPPAPGRVGGVVLYGARHPDHAALAFLALVAAVAGLLIATRKRPRR